MKHTCPDGSVTRLVRDPAVPVGFAADHSCPHCAAVFTADDVLADVAALDRTNRAAFLNASRNDVVRRSLRRRLVAA